MSPDAGRPPCRQAAARGAADRELDVTALEPGTHLREAIEVRGPHHGIPVARERVGAELIGHEQDDVGAPSGAGTRVLRRALRGRHPRGFSDRASAHEAEAPSSSRRVHFAPLALIVRI